MTLTNTDQPNPSTFKEIQLDVWRWEEALKSAPVISHKNDQVNQIDHINQIDQIN